MFSTVKAPWAFTWRPYSCNVSTCVANTTGFSYHRSARPIQGLSCRRSCCAQGGNAAKCVTLLPDWEFTPPGTNPDLIIDSRLLRVVEWYAIETSAAIVFVKRAPILSGSMTTSYPPPSVEWADVARTATGCAHPSVYSSLALVHPFWSNSGMNMLMAGSSLLLWICGSILTASIWNLVLLLVLKHSKFCVKKISNLALRTLIGMLLSSQCPSCQM